MNVALIGYGYWGKILEKYIVATKYFKLLKIYNRKFNNGDLFTDNINDIICNKDIEIIFLATPIETHFNYIVLCLSYKKVVFCEKPLIAIGEDIKYIKNLLKLKQGYIYTDYTYLVSKSIQYIKNKLFFLGSNIYIDATFKQYGKFYKSNVFEVLGAHYLSIFIYWFDIKDVSQVNIEYIDGFIDEDNIVQSGMIKIRYRNVNININLSLVAENKERKIEILGEEKKIIFNMCEEYQIKEYEYSNYKNIASKRLVKKMKFDETNNLAFVMEDFYEKLIKKDNTNMQISIIVQELLNKYVRC